MILIGLTGWGDHPSLYDDPTSKNKLVQYSGHFPIVEIDTSYYAIQPQRNYIKWASESPATFTFIVKAYQGMTGHLRDEIPFDSEKEMFDAFKASIQPLIEGGKLKVVLFQYPPWFACNKDSVEILRRTKEFMGDIPVALEFRHQSWFHPAFRDKTLAFMKEEGWVHSICDEPQSGEGSIPTVLEPTSGDLTVVRFHGRNMNGWKRSGRNTQDWREVRYLYRYNNQELMEWKQHLLKLKEQTKDICVLFNNNSGGDAADNAKQLIDLLGIEYEGLAPRQMNLF